MTQEQKYLYEGIEASVDFAFSLKFIFRNVNLYKAPSRWRIYKKTSVSERLFN